MPRKARIDAVGALHHIICRGIEKRPIFMDDVDRDGFIVRLRKILTETKTPCYAWALLPNHFHLLLRTGMAPIARVMQRLLTGYVVVFNRRHQRHGYLFQNRYKSILCQENPYLLELVRYIHLNPLRAGVLKNLKDLDQYFYCGHSRIMGKVQDQWQDVDRVLSMFGDRNSDAQKKYRQFVEKGLAEGKKSELTGGGLIRSLGGWQAVKQLRLAGEHFKSDERILGDSDFVTKVLKQASEKMARKYDLVAKGYGFETALEKVSENFGITGDQLLTPSKKPQRVMARSVLAYWAVRELELTATEVGKRMGISQSAVSRAVQRGEKLVQESKLEL